MLCGVPASIDVTEGFWWFSSKARQALHTGWLGRGDFSWNLCPWGGISVVAVVKECRCSLLRPAAESRELSLGCSSSASSTHRGPSARFTKKPNTFLGWEVEPELAFGRAGLGT